MTNAKDYLATLEPRLGTEIGVTEWLAYDQADVDAHSSLTGDDGPIHSDPEWAARETAFGGSIVQGSLLLSTFTKMAKSLKWPDGDIAYRMNYGFDRIRIISPVKTGQRFKGKFVLKEVSPKTDSAILIKMNATIEAEGADRPAVVAEWLAFMQFNS